MDYKTEEEQNGGLNTNPDLPYIQSNKIKLTKNAKGLYQWEISILSLDVEELKRINLEMEKNFGSVTA